MPEKPSTKASQNFAGTPDLGGPTKAGRDLGEPGMPPQAFDGNPIFAPGTKAREQEPPTPAASQNTKAPDIIGKPEKV